MLLYGICMPTAKAAALSVVWLTSVGADSDLLLHPALAKRPPLCLHADAMPLLKNLL
jgi:hypothetical protein